MWPWRTSRRRPSLSTRCSWAPRKAWTSTTTALARRRLAPERSTSVNGSLNDIFSVLKGLDIRVESRRGAVAWALWASLRFLSRSSNRTCGFPASGFPTGFTSKHTAVGQDGPDVVGSHRTPRTRPYRGNAWCLATTPCGRFRLRLDVELPPKAPELLGCCQDHRHSPLLAIIKSVPEVRALCSAGITQPHSSYGPVRRPRGPSPKVTSRARPSSPPGLPRLPVSLFQRAVPTTPADQDGCTCRLLPRPARPSPDHRRVGIRDFTFEACSGFTRITARWIAQPPKAAFVTGLRSIRLPGQTACQLPDQTDNCLGGSFLH